LRVAAGRGKGGSEPEIGAGDSVTGGAGKLRESKRHGFGAGGTANLGNRGEARGRDNVFLKIRNRDRRKCRPSGVRL